MNTDDRKEFFEILVGAAEVSQATLTEHGMALYWKMLESYELNEIEQSVIAYFRNPDNSGFMPKPQDIIRHIEGSSDSKALQAWSKFDKAVRCIGPFRSVVFDDPLIHIVVCGMGGWIQFGTMTDDDYKFKTHEFIRRYRALTNKPIDSHPCKLIGIAEMDNESNARPVPTPVFVGDRHKAVQVLESGKADGIEIHYEQLPVLEHQG